MEKEKLEGMLIDYLDDRLDREDRRLVEAELSTNPESRKLLEDLRKVTQLIDRSAELEPSPALRKNFEQSLTEMSRPSKGGRMLFFNPVLYRVAAAIALVVLSGALGFWFSKHQAQQDRIAEMEVEMEMTRKQLEDTRRLMFSMLGNDQSASQRIKGVNVAMEITEVDNEIVKALFHTMLTDRSTNVRLAALDALGKFRQDPSVRKGLIDALSRQTDPMVQINLIQLMVQMNEKEAVKDLQRMVEDESTMKAVRDEAYSGILKLS